MANVPQETVMSIADFKLKEGGSMVAKHFEGAGNSGSRFRV